jgi:hypothetical protein
LKETQRGKSSIIYEGYYNDFQQKEWGSKVKSSVIF